MITKSYSKNGKNCRLVFEIPAGTAAQQAFLCGDFTKWEKTCIPMMLRKDGSFTTSVTLKTGQSYYFRYLLDEGRWENDEAADRYFPNPFGTEDCIVDV